MKIIKRKLIDQNNTAKNLKLLRQDNLDLRRYVCSALNFDKGNCDGLCDTCKYDMDHSISQAELARAFGVSESMVANWENCKSFPHLEDLIFYSEVCGIDLFDIVVFAD